MTHVSIRRSRRKTGSQILPGTRTPETPTFHRPFEVETSCASSLSLQSYGWPSLVTTYPRRVEPSAGMFAVTSVTCTQPDI
jgi:hypothetical protein